MHDTAHVVIGFGKAGKMLAAELAERSEHGTLVERSTEMSGGTCITLARIPTKALSAHGATPSLPTPR